MFYDDDNEDERADGCESVDDGPSDDDISNAYDDGYEDGHAGAADADGPALDSFISQILNPHYDPPNDSELESSYREGFEAGWSAYLSER